jgi:LysM repeat protein
MNRTFRRAGLSAAIAALLASGAWATDDIEFQRAQSAVFPMTPEQIRQFREAHDATQRAGNDGELSGEAQRRGTALNIDLTSGATGQVGQLVLGYATTVMVTGENGAPWPIEKVYSGNGNAVSAEQASEENPVSALLTVRMPWVETNLSIFLRGKPEPVTIFLRTSADPVDGLHSRINVRVAGNPPGTLPLPVRNTGVVSDAMMNAINHSPGSEWRAYPLGKSSGLLPFRINLWSAPDGKGAIVRLGNGAAMRQPDWKTQATSTDTTVRVYEFETMPLLMQVVDRDGVRYSVQIDNPVATLASRDPKPTMNVTAASAVESVAAGPIPAHAATPAPPVTNSPGVADHQEYTVRPGDTLRAIAERHGRDYRELAAWNSLTPPYTIYPGQRLRVALRQANDPAVVSGAEAVDRYRPADASFRASGISLTGGRSTAEAPAVGGTGRSGSAPAEAPSRSEQDLEQLKRTYARLKADDASAASPSTELTPATMPAASTPLRVWTLDNRKTLKENLDAWASEAGWHLVWDLSVDYPVAAPASFGGDFVQATEAVMHSLQDAGSPIGAKAYDGNRVMRILRIR